MGPLIVIGSTDLDYCLLLEHILKVAGFDTVFGKTVEEVLYLGAHCAPCAILLDSKVSASCALSACVQLKKDPRTAEILTIALIQPRAENQYVDMLKAGIDESFIRPIIPSQLLDTLQAKAQTGHPLKAFSGNVCLWYAGIEMNLATHRVQRDGVEIHLGMIEFKLLSHLLRKPEQVCKRHELVADVWPKNIHVEPRTVNVHIARLRKALTVDGAPDLIRTVRSAGYALDGTSHIGAMAE